MSTITIDGVAYATDSLSKEAKAELAGMQACDQKIACKGQILDFYHFLTYFKSRLCFRNI